MKPDERIIDGGLRLRRLWVALQHGWSELFAASPVLLAAAALYYGNASDAWQLVAGLAGYTLWSALAASVPVLRWTVVLILSNVVLVAGWGFLLHGVSYSLILSLMAGIVLAFRATKLVRYGDQASFRTLALWMGLATCAPVAFVIHQAKDIQEAGALSTGLTIITALLFVFAVFVSNTASMERGSYGSRQASASGQSLRRFNRLLMLGFMLIVLAFSFWGIIDRIIQSAGRVLVRVLAFLLGTTENPEEPPVQTPPPGGEGQMLPRPDGKASIVWVILEYVVAAAIAAGAIWLLYLGLRRLIRHLPGRLRSALAWLIRYRSRSQDDDLGYVDVVTSTRDERGPSASKPWSRLKRLFTGGSEVRWEELPDNRQRVRHLYAQAVQRSVRSGFRWKPQWTPEETAAEAARSREAAGLLAADLCRAYDQARYGGAAPDDEETKRLKAAQSRHGK